MLLDQYRRSFSTAYQSVVQILSNDFGLHPTGRPSKSTLSIIHKLQRESLRLSQMQDVAGCRVVVADVKSQDEVVNQLQSRFPKAILIDRRQRPSHGYRAVHLISHSFDRSVEIQIRTSLQQRWAELSEKLADEFGQELKYGQGHERLQQQLDQLSDIVGEIERIESRVLKLNWTDYSAPGVLTTDGVTLLQVQQKLDRTRQQLNDILLQMIRGVREFE